MYRRGPGVTSTAPFKSRGGTSATTLHSTESVLSAPAIDPLYLMRHFAAHELRLVRDRRGGRAWRSSSQVRVEVPGRARVGDEGANGDYGWSRA
jgi:hypothetical protein